MTQGITRERLADLLVDPREDLNFEVKNWLDLQGNNEDKAIFAKAVLAIANHGGGFIALGLLETDVGIVEAEGRPATLDGYSHDLINGIVQNYCDPQFHCAVHIVANPAGSVFPIVVIPGGHRVPVRSRRAGPNGNIVQNNAIYIRKPGPRSETPQSAQEWDDLLSRCLRNRRDELFDQIRDLIMGAVPQVEQPPEPARLDDWIRVCFERWHTLTQGLPAHVGPRFSYGYYNFIYEIIGERRQIASSQLPDVLRASVARYTGWPPFWYPTREGIQPYPLMARSSVGLVEIHKTTTNAMRLTQTFGASSDGLHSYFVVSKKTYRCTTSVRGPVLPVQYLMSLSSVAVARLFYKTTLAANLFDGPST
jgi:hypothetical protein